MYVLGPPRGPDSGRGEEGRNDKEGRGGERRLGKGRAVCSCVEEARGLAESGAYCTQALCQGTVPEMVM